MKRTVRGTCPNGHVIEKEIETHVPIDVEMDDGRMLSGSVPVEKIVAVCRKCKGVEFVTLYDANEEVA